MAETVKSLTDRFHSFNVFEGLHIAKNGALSAVWQLEELNLLRLTEEDHLYYSQRLSQFLQGLPEQTDIQFLYNKYLKPNNDPSKAFYAHSPNKEIHFLNQQRSRMALQPFYHTDVFLVITFNNLLENFKRRNFNDIFLFNPKLPGSLLKEKFFSDLTTINQLEEQIVKEIDFLSPRRLNSAQIIRLLSNYYNLSQEFTRPLQVRNEYFNQDLLYRDISWDKSGVAVGQDYLLLISLIELPSRITNPLSGQRFFRSPLEHFLEFRFPCRLAVSFHKLPQAVALKKLNSIRNMSKGFSSMNALAERRIEEIEGDLEGRFEGLEPLLQRGEDSLVDFSLTVMTWNKLPDILKQRELEILNKFGSFFSARGMVENKDALPLFLGNAPGNFVNHYRSVLLRQSNAADFINLSGYYRGTATGVSFVNLNDETVLYDLFAAQNENFNAIIVGPSGSGKSFLCANVIHKYLEQAVPVVVLDVGGSYKPLVKLLKGDYIEINKATPTYLDPLYYFNPRQHPSNSPAYFDSLKFVQYFLEVMVARTDQQQRELPKHHRAIFLQGIERFFSQRPAGSAGDTLFDLLAYFKEDSQFFHNDQEYRNYVFKALELYLNGTMREYFHPDNPNRLKLLNLQPEDISLMAFDLKGIEGEQDLLPLYAFLLTKSVSRLMESSHQRFIFIQDEAWKTLSQSKAIRDFTLYMYRTARKWGSAILSISQHADDLSRGDLAAGIITNSDTKILLRHRPEDIPQTVEVFNLAPAESTAFSSLKQHEIFLSVHGEPAILKAHFSPYDYWLYTTRADERRQREEALQHYNDNLTRALAALVEEEK